MANPTKPVFIARQVEEGRYFFLDLKPNQNIDLAIVCGGREKCATNYQVNRKTFPYHALEYVASGKGRVMLNGREHEIGPGSVFAYGPGIRHRIRATGPGRLIKYFIDFTGQQAAPLLRHVDLTDHQPHKIHNTRWVQTNFDQLLACGLGNRATAKQQCIHLLHLILLHINSEAIPLDASNSNAFETYAACRAYIEEHYTNTHTVGEVAKKIGIDPSYQSRIFQRFAREKPYQYLVRMKMDHAAELLTQGQSVTQAGAAVGFADPYHFSRVFKKTHGLSPKKFVQASGRTAPFSSRKK